MLLTRREAIWGASVVALLPVHLRAATQERSPYTISMHTTHPDEPARRMTFSPRVMRIPRGAVVRFVPSEPNHNCQSTPGMVPEGAEPWRGAFGKAISVRLTTPGYYGYHCLAHRSMGMVGLLIVEGEGMGDNFEAARAVQHSGRATEAWEQIWKEVSSG